MNLTDKCVLITGAAGELGSAMVYALLDAGAGRIIACDIHAEKLRLFKDERVYPLVCDVSDAEAVYDALHALPAEVEAIDILINNVGILHSDLLVNLFEHSKDIYLQKAADWQRVMDINLSSAFYLSQCVASLMVKKRTKGVLINMSSVSAQGNAGQSVYAASKAGMEALTRVWAKELGGLGIRSVAIAPGYIDTPSTRSAVSKEQLNNIAGNIPLKKLGSAEHIIQTMLFAIENDYVNGTVLHIDGGLKL